MSTSVMGTFYQGILTVAAQTLYTVAPGETFIPKTISLCNFGGNGTNAAKVTLNFVANGDIIANKNFILKDKMIAPPEVLFVNSDMYLQSGYTIQASADQENLINCQISGVKLT